MTVLHVAAGNAYGGIERMLATLAALPPAGLEQHFAVAFRGRLDDELSAAGAAVHRLPSPRAARPLRVLRARRAFATVLDAVAPEVTLFHGAWPHAMFAVVARRAGTRIGFWQHQPVARPAWPDRWARRVRPDFVIYNSRFTAASPAFPGVPGTVLYCPVSSPRPTDDGGRPVRRRQLGAGDGDVVVLMAARLERWKGHAVLLDAVARLDPASGIKVWIAGGPQGESERRLHGELTARAAAPEQRGRVTLLGRRDDVPALMALADIYCQPNLQPEPFGISIAEAMLAGLPCVVSAGGGAAELLDDSCGVLTGPGDVEAVAAALQTLAADAGRRRTMGAAARKRAAALTGARARYDDLVAIVGAHAG